MAIEMVGIEMLRNSINKSMVGQYYFMLAPEYYCYMRYILIVISFFISQALFNLGKNCIQFIRT
jgi:hypothetical protein